MSTTKSKRRRVRVETGIYRSYTGRLEVCYRDSDGRLRFKSVEGGIRAARAERTAVAARKDKGEHVVSSRITFSDYAQRWLETLTLRPGTLALYRGHLETHLLPAFGRKRLSEITVDDVARLIARMSKASADRPEGYSPHTIRAVLTPLGRILGNAERAGLIARNPVRQLSKSERPAASNGERRHLSEQELRTLLAAAGERHAALLALGAFTGLRIGEALGLRWQDVDFAAERITVRHALARDGQLVEPKTPRARRTVVLMPELARILVSHRASSPHRAPSDFVFSGPKGGPRNYRSTLRVVERIAGKAGLEHVSFHTLRHTFASMLISELGQDVETVGRKLGHASAAITLGVYSHEFAAERSDEALSQGLSQRFGSLLALDRTQVAEV